MSYWPVGLGQAAIKPGTQVPVEEQVLVPTACPECSYLEAGTCRWCPDHADIPGCLECEGKKRPPPSWYERSEFVIPMLTAVGTALVSSLAIAYALRKFGPAPVRAS